MRYFLCCCMVYCCVPLLLSGQTTAWQCFEKGKQLQAAQQLDESRVWYRQAIEAYQATGEADSLTMVYHEVIYSWIDQRDYAATLREFDELFALYAAEDWPISFVLAKTYSLRAFVRNRLNEQAAALMDYEQAINLYDALEVNHKNVAYAYRNAAMLLMQKQDYPKTIHYLKRALERDSTGRYEASIYGQLANCHLFIPEFTETLKYYQLGLDILEQQEPSPRRNKDIALLHSIASDAHFGLRAFDQSEWHAQQALHFYRQNDRYWSYRFSRYVNLARVYMELKEEEQALRYFTKALEEKAQYADYKSRTFASLYAHLGDFYFRKGEYYQALEYVQQGLQQVFPGFAAA
ncbi:MAG: tetratricopeptide repeat protein, partial [Bacteroidota bacterium]